MRFIWTELHGLRAGSLAIDRLAKFGARLQPGSRLLASVTRVERAIERRTVDPAKDGDFAYRLAESHRTILEFYIISSALGEVDGIDEKRLNLALSGHDLPEEDTLTTGARDAQFELLVTALVHHAGIRDVSVGEPDIRIKAGDRCFGIAAKRVSSRRQLEKHLRKSSKQIRQQDDYGLIALNLDGVIDPIYRLHGVERARSAFRSLILESHDFIESHGYGGHVAGLQGFATILGWESADGNAVMGLEVLSHSHWVSSSEDLDRMRQFIAGRGVHLQDRLAHLFNLCV